MRALRLGLAGAVVLLGVSSALAAAQSEDADAAGAWSPAGALAHPRSPYGSTTAGLADGRVLVLGETEDGEQSLPAEVWDPDTATFGLTGMPLQRRATPTATPLLDGRILVVGGGSSPAAEVWDPVTGIFTATGSLGENRAGHTATRLLDGRVLVVGGVEMDWLMGEGAPTLVSPAEVFDPASGTFTPTGSPSTVRFMHTATLLPDGRVLLVGDTELDPQGGTQSAETWDPMTDTFSPAGSLTVPRRTDVFLIHAGHAATALDDGRVLIVGTGEDAVPAEVWDPETATFEEVGRLQGRSWGLSATLLPDGRVLVAGGAEDRSTELWDPATGASVPAGRTALRGGEAQPLPDGRVLVIDGTAAEVWALAE